MNEIPILPPVASEPLQGLPLDLENLPDLAEESFSPLPLEEIDEATLKELLTLCKQRIVKAVKEKKSDKSPCPTPLEMLVTVPLLSPALPVPAPSTTCFARLSVSSLYTEKLGCDLMEKLEVVHKESSSKTTVWLPHRESFDSPFRETTIVIEEFSTAPKVFNVSIQAGERALTLLQSHMAGFMQALQTKQHPFTIHRMELCSLSSYSQEQDSGSSSEDNEQEQP